MGPRGQGPWRRRFGFARILTVPGFALRRSARVMPVSWGRWRRRGGPTWCAGHGARRAAFPAAPSAWSACSSDRRGETHAFHRPGTRSRSACPGAGPCRSPPHARGNFFKSSKRLVILAIGLGTNHHGAELHLPQDPAHRLLRERDAELFPDPANQVLQAPAHHAVSRGKPSRVTIRKRSYKMMPSDGPA